MKTSCIAEFFLAWEKRENTFLQKFQPKIVPFRKNFIKSDKAGEKKERVIYA
jgi:hypothetical protein